jgi:polysaccharide export outer membrane protein
VGEVREMLTDRYKEYLRTPAIEVTVLRRIGVHGEVKAPTLYWVDLTMTLRDAIALAGGLTPAGDENKILVERRGQRIRFGEAETAATLAAGLESGDQIVVERRNWFDLNTPFVISTIVSVSSIFVGFLIAR